jgi:hypothetical protein
MPTTRTGLRTKRANRQKNIEKEHVHQWSSWNTNDCQQKMGVTPAQTHKPASQTETIWAQMEPSQGKHVKASVSNGDQTHQSQHLKRRPSGHKQNPTKANTSKASVSNGDHPGSNGTWPRKTRQSQRLKRRPNTSKPASQTETIWAQMEPGQGKHVKSQRLKWRPSGLKRNHEINHKLNGWERRIVQSQRGPHPAISLWPWAVCFILIETYTLIINWIRLKLRLYSQSLPKYIWLWLLQESYFQHMFAWNRLPAGTHETKKKVLCRHRSSKHAKMHSNTLLLPFYWRKMPVFDSSLKISPRDDCHCCSDMLFGMPKYNPG